MLMLLPKFEYLNCESLEEACALLSKYGDEARVLSGGTDLIVKMKHKMMTPGYLINIKRFPELSYIRKNEDHGVNIGTLTTLQAVKNSPLIKKGFPALHDAAGVLGTRQVRNLATMGGNLCNASPAAECAPPLLALNAKVRIKGEKGQRRLDLKHFFTGPGETALEHDEILAEIQIPEPPARSTGVYLKHSTRRIDVAMVGVAVIAQMEENRFKDIRIALGAVGPTPLRAPKAEAVLIGKEPEEKWTNKAANAASDESVPIDDIRGYRDYRKKMVGILVKKAIDGAMSRAK
jgi:carbon-monoxide dehydrogenase medium subunit